MLKKFLNTKFHLRFTINPLIRYKAERMEGDLCVNFIKREIPIIVSITSYEERFSDLVLSLYSMLNQTTKPDRIILWLSDSIPNLTYIPYEITKFIKNGLEIKFVKDIGSYTKIIYALKEFSDAIIVTADDDIYYPKDWLEKLYRSYIMYPNDIQVHRAHRVILNNEEICPYETWQKHIDEESACYSNFLTGVGGVLYPPHCFIKEVFREDIFLKNSPYADDIWLWTMSLLSNRKIRVVEQHIKTLTCTNIFRQIGICKGKTLYATNRLGINDIQLNNLLKFYKQNVMSKLVNNK